MSVFAALVYRCGAQVFDVRRKGAEVLGHKKPLPLAR